MNEESRKKRQGAAPETQTEEEKERAARAKERRRSKRVGMGLFMDQRYTQISAYVVATVIIIYVLIQLTYHVPTIVTGIGTGMHALGVVFRPLILGFVIAYLMYPVTRFIEHRIEAIPFYKKRGKSGLGMAVLITYILVTAGLTVLMSVVISSVSHELTLVTLDSLTDFVEDIARSLNSLYITIQKGLRQLNLSSSDVDNVAKELGEWASGIIRMASNGVLRSMQNITGILTNVLFAIILSIYFLLDADNLQAYWDRVLKAVTSKKAYRHVHTLLDDADYAFSGYIRGQLLDAIFMFAVVSIALSVLHVKFAVIIGILTGIGNLIPYVGPVFAYGGTVFGCILEGDLKKLIISFIVVFTLQTIDGNIVNPRLMSHSIHVHPMLVIVALIAGNSMGGVMGMLLAVPVSALLKLWFDRAINSLMKQREKSERSRE